jgi:hypothetical protein
MAAVDIAVLPTSYGFSAESEYIHHSDQPAARLIADRTKRKRHVLICGARMRHTAQIH